MLLRQKLTLQIVVVTIALFCFGGVARAQSTATLQGTVKDEKGSVVPGASPPITVGGKMRQLSDVADDWVATLVNAVASGRNSYSRCQVALPPPLQ